MTDWKKLKVVELREECKARDIPLAGIKLKQQYIDKLEEYEANRAPGIDAKASVDVPSEPTKANVSSEKPESLNGDAHTDAEQAENAAVSQDEASHVEGETDRHTPPNNGGKVEPLAATASDEPVQKEQPGDERVLAIDNVEETKGEQIGQQDQASDDASKSVTQAEAAGIGEEEPSDSQDASKERPSIPTPLDINTAPVPPSSVQESTQPPSPQLAGDQRKRKRSSATPVPIAEEAAPKRARTEDGNTESTAKSEEPLPQIHEGVEAAKSHGGPDSPPEVSVVLQPEDKRGEEARGFNEAKETSFPSQAVDDADTAEGGAMAQSDRESYPAQDVARSIHPPTSSLYIRNLKRPLHIPTLKQHVANLSKSRTEPENSQIKSFYLDSIRSHAFIAFTSPSAASRVRAAMHQTRFPDEPQREPLFVDYVPDDRIQEWIDQETGSGFGRGGNNKRFEIVYSQGPDGVEATLQDGDQSRPRPALPAPAPRRPVPGEAPREPAARGLHSVHSVHPERAGLLVGRGDDRRPTFPERPQKHDAGERGFKALDELFSFTAAKPKLYYKPVAPEVVDRRRRMIKALRVAHTDMGRSGDEGMKRYTFETMRGREQWVDKGPEFGHGQRGLAILRGEQRGRGRGRFRAGRGDSWRGRQ